MNSPLDVVCPKCKAAIGAQCTKPVQFGNQFTDTFCAERIDKAKELASA